MRKDLATYEINIPVVEGEAVVLIEGRPNVVLKGDMIIARVNFTLTWTKRRWFNLLHRVTGIEPQAKLEVVSVNPPPPPPIPSFVRYKRVP